MEAVTHQIEPSYLRASLFAVVLVTVMLNAGVCIGQPLSVSWLTEDQERSVLTLTGEIWPWWENQDRDSIVLNADDYSIPGRAGSDARVVVKAVGGLRGLYVFVRITESDISVFDGLSVYHDSNSSEYINTCDLSCGDKRQGLLWTGKAVYHRLFSNQVTLYWTDENLWCGLCPDFWSFAEIESFTDVVIRSINLANDTVVLQYRMTWAMLGARKAFYFKPEVPREQIVPARGTLSAFAIDYQDVDTEGSDTGWIAWKRASAWVPDSTNSYHYWGDLVFGPGFPEVATPAESLLAVAPRSKHSGSMRGAAGNLNTARFTLTGRRTTSDGAAAIKQRCVQVSVGEGGRRMLEVGW